MLERSYDEERYLEEVWDDVDNQYLATYFERPEEYSTIDEFSLHPSGQDANMLTLALSAVVMLAVFTSPVWAEDMNADTNALVPQKKSAIPTKATTLRGSASFSAPHFPVSPQAKSSKKAYYTKDRQVFKGDVLAEAWQLGNAEAEYRKALEKNPNNPGAHNGLGKVLYYKTTSSNQSVRDQEQGMLTEAMQCFMTAIRLQPNYVEARINLGKVYQELQRPTEALQQFEKALALNPNDSEALERYGSLLVEQQDYNKAIPYLEKSIKIYSGNTSAHVHLGQAYIARGEYDKAHEHLQIAMYQAPENAPTHYQTGKLYESQGNGAAAVNAYKQSLELKPEYRAPAEQLANHYLERGDNPFALEQLQNMLESYPDDRDLRHQVAKLLVEGHQNEIAIRHYQRLLAEDPADNLAKAGLSKAELSIAKKALTESGPLGATIQQEWTAHKAAEQSLVFNPANTEAHLIKVKLEGAINPDFVNEINVDRNLYVATLSQAARTPHEFFKQGEMLIDRYQFLDADTAFTRSIQASSRPSDVLTMGESLLTLGMPDMAEKAFQRARQLGMNSELTEFAIEKARAAKKESQSRWREARYFRRENGFLRTNRYPTLESYYVEALRLNQKNTNAHLALAHYYESAKDPGKAADHYYAYLQINPAAEDRKRVEARIMSLKQRLARG